MVFISGVCCEYSPYFRAQYTLDTLVTSKQVFSDVCTPGAPSVLGDLYTAQ